MKPLPSGQASILLTDPPDHTRLRRLVAQAFTNRRVEQMRPHVAAHMDELLTAMVDKGPPSDLVRDFTLPLPTMVICELIGVPYEDRNRFRGWVVALTSTTACTPEEVDQAIDEFSDYVAELVAERRERPTDDLLGALVRARDEGRLLSEEELLTFVGVLLVAGHENTANQLANIIYTLLARPGLLDRLRGIPPELFPTAMEELLRYVVIGTGVSLALIAKEDVTISGVLVRRGDAVMVSTAAANRDPRAFHDPTELDLGRTPNPHLVFGPGVHHCLGSSLARMELQEAIRALMDRFPGLRLAVDAKDVPWKAGISGRGPSELPITW